MNNKILIVLLELIFLIVFNIIFFVKFDNRVCESVWISYFFIHLSYLMLVLTPNFTRKSPKTGPLGLSMMAISSLYFSLIFMLGIVMMLLQLDSYKLSFIINMTLTGLFGILIIPNYFANETTVRNLSTAKINREFVTIGSNKIKYLKTLISEKELHKMLDQLYDVFISCPVKSCFEVQGIEIETLGILGSIEKELEDNDIDKIKTMITTITKNLNKRNSIIKSCQ